MIGVIRVSSCIRGSFVTSERMFDVGRVGYSDAKIELILGGKRNHLESYKTCKVGINRREF